MSVSAGVLRGYILEEVLAYLIKNTGYRLITSAREDPEQLLHKHHGLVVRGRGSLHQADVLGELSWVPAFTYPLRLIVEAKFHRNRTGIQVVRSMIGTLLDVNQNNMPTTAASSKRAQAMRKKYHYAGSVFSTSGFSRDAVNMALAHGVSLLDLSGPEYQRLLDGVRESADSLVGIQSTEEAPILDYAEDEPADQISRANVSEIRRALRGRLGTVTSNRLDEAEQTFPRLERPLSPAIEAAEETGELFVGMGRGPHMLTLKANSTSRFLNYARNNPDHEVYISWSEDQDNGRTWRITPRDSEDAYQLSFRIPEAIGDMIFGSSNIGQAAIRAKQEFFSEIMIYRREPDRDLLIRLRFKLD